MAFNSGYDYTSEGELLVDQGVPVDQSNPYIPDSLANVMEGQMASDRPQIFRPQDQMPVIEPQLEDVIAQQGVQPTEDTVSTQTSSPYQDTVSTQASAPEVDARTPMQKMMDQYRELADADKKELADARQSDRNLKMGGALADSLSTIINARGQMNAKVPGVPVQQGSGASKITDMFQRAPEVASDMKSRREDLLAQYKQLAAGDRSAAASADKKAMMKHQKDISDAQIKSREGVARDNREAKANKESNKEKPDKYEAVLEKQFAEELGNVGNLQSQLELQKQIIDHQTKHPGIQGPLAGRTFSITPAAQRLENLYSKSIWSTIKSDNIKASTINSNAERAALEQSSENMKNAPEVNNLISLGRQSITLKQLELAKAKEKWIQEGNKLRDFKHPIKEGKIDVMMDRSGEMKLINVDDMGTEEFKKQGYLTVDQYAKMTGKGVQPTAISRRDMPAQPKQAITPPKDNSSISPEVAEYAKQYNMSPAKAEAILKYRRGE
jgi:hypothetical protein